MAEPQRLVDPPKEVSLKRQPTWARELIHNAERYSALEGSLRERKRPRTYSSYMALLSDIIDAEPLSFEEASLEGCDAGGISVYNENDV